MFMGVNVEKIDADSLTLEERVVSINRVAKVVKGGRRFSFSALVVVGNGDGVVGVGFGKAKEVPLSIQKAIGNAKKDLHRINRSGNTITHEIMGRYGAGMVFMKPASPGTGVIAGGPVRAIMELAGIKDVLTKSLGSSNPINILKAAEQGLVTLKSRERRVKAERRTDDGGAEA